MTPPRCQRNGAEGQRARPQGSFPSSPRGALINLYFKERILQIHSLKLPDQTALKFPFSLKITYLKSDSNSFVLFLSNKPKWWKLSVCNINTSRTKQQWQLTPQVNSPRTAWSLLILVLSGHLMRRDAHPKWWGQWDKTQVWPVKIARYVLDA